MAVKLSRVLCSRSSSFVVLHYRFVGRWQTRCDIVFVNSSYQNAYHFEEFVREHEREPILVRKLYDMIVVDI